MLEEMILGHQNCLMSMVEEQHKNCFSNLEQELTPSLQSIALELNALRATVQNPSSNVDLIDELRSIHDAVAAKPVTPLLEPGTCLAEELNQQISQKIVSGWRLLGTRKVWKADWTEYDNRQLRLKKQQLKADKAKKRRQRKARNINNNNMNPHINSRSTHNMNYPLPPDRELLAAAKNLFSRPPASPSKRRSKRGIQFIRGETLNPPKDNVRGTPSPVPSPRRSRRPIITAPTVPPNLPTNSSPEVSPRRKRRPRITVPAVPPNLPTNHNGNMTPSVPPVSPQATFAYPFPNPYVTPFAAPCCHRAPTAPTAFDYPFKMVVVAVLGGGGCWWWRLEAAVGGGGRRRRYMAEMR
ncbi:arp2/3 complex-activating protein rickA-like [Uranotaenia lowii]|uniref:arp2/3 complex-activating protein rickA-like n=1 Tax=Uranotaenia lowii TaxID=190385 RepID=UPI002478F26A|nr:arp2/3 complex-activating protein rickA-like [Uranotaenia lowii]